MNIRILKVEICNIPILGDNVVSIDFVASQRVSEDDKSRLYNIFNNVYQSEALAFVGINASGKTTMLKLLSFTMSMLNNKPLNSIGNADFMNLLDSDSPAIITTYFSANDSVYQLMTEIVRIDGRLVISNETLKEKSFRNVKFKKLLYDFSGIEPVMDRSLLDRTFLLDDVSIMVSFNKKYDASVYFIDLLKQTNRNYLENTGSEFPVELIEFLDPSVEYFRLVKSMAGYEFQLKFKRYENVIYLKRVDELDRYLSSGTIKGINIFMDAVECFRRGGYLLVDELENHFNKEIIASLIRFFMNGNINTEGSVLLFSTHYSEILDEFDRNDSVYIVRNENGIELRNLSDILKRNDIKKSEAFLSGFLGGTAPKYKSFMALKKYLLDIGKE